MPSPAGDAGDADDVALFVPEGRHLAPTELARGPWSPMALHGGPVAALATRASEAHPGGEGMQLVRITLELLRPVPLTRLAVTSALVKPGRRAQLVDTAIEADGVEVAWSRALRILARSRGPAGGADGPRGHRARPPRPADGHADDDR